MCAFARLNNDAIVNADVRSAKRNPEYWKNQGQDALNTVLNVKENRKVAKNVILFLGDGMDVTTITAARIYKGQKDEQSKKHLVWDDFPNIAMLKTYNLDKHVPDSAATATAFLCGVKANFKTLGLNGKAQFANCSSSFGTHVDSIAVWSLLQGVLEEFWRSSGRVLEEFWKNSGGVLEEFWRNSGGVLEEFWRNSGGVLEEFWRSSGGILEEFWRNSEGVLKEFWRSKDVGIVTTAKVVDASPGAVYGHKDLYEKKVILGAGRGYFFPNTTIDKANNLSNFRQDSKDLVDTWIQDKVNRNKTHKYVEDFGELKAVNASTTDYLFGLFGQYEMDYELDRNKEDNGQPSISEMTEKAIDILSKSEKGFFLFVEGSKIDVAHHLNLAKKALEETVQMENAVKIAMEMTDPDETLIVVTADHAHSMSLAGNFGDNLPYTSLLYTSGKGYKVGPDGRRINLTNVDTENKDFVNPAGFKSNGAKHTGSDVQAFATGPMSHLFRGTQEQTFLAHAMAYASCVGENQNHCFHPRI
ncbi:Alkaline phosphatase, tissue-nonspecific isozyme [Nymphon striatum]|nr:Alkaline phosphatase, tissue-nonspecific isozyme [Nymphon striatum]